MADSGMTGRWWTRVRLPDADSKFVCSCAASQPRMTIEQREDCTMPGTCTPAVHAYPSVDGGYRRHASRRLYTLGSARSTPVQRPSNAIIP